MDGSAIAAKEDVKPLWAQAPQWKHVVIDNFLTAQDFDELSKTDTSGVAADSLKIIGNRVKPDGSKISGSLPEDVLRRLQATYHPKAIALLQQLAPAKVPLYEYSEFEIVVTGKDRKFPVHHDVGSKLLSSVVYLAPEHNSGTLLYSSKSGDGRYEVEWRRNRALIFSRRDGETWHSYEGDGRSNRLALVYNLKTSNISGVYRAEGKSYLAYRAKRTWRKILSKASED